MQELSKKALIFLKSNPNASQEELKILSQEIISSLLSSNYSNGYKKKLTMLIRKDIKQVAGSHAILDFLKLPADFIAGIKGDYQVTVWSRLQDKEVISLPENEAIGDALLIHEKPELILLGIALSTGRRYSEIKASNFDPIKENPSDLMFKGQTKKVEGQAYDYTIPLLSSREMVMKAFINLYKIEKDKGAFLTTDAFYQRVNRHCHWLFKHEIHALRAKYCSLIMTREGVLESDSTKEPMARAKELLGHTVESDATFSYRQYAVSKEILNQKSLDKKIKDLSLHPTESEKYINIGTFNIGKELENIVSVDLIESSWSTFLPVVKSMYKEKYERTANYYAIKRFYQNKRQELLESIEK